MSLLRIPRTGPVLKTLAVVSVLALLLLFLTKEKAFSLQKALELGSISSTKHAYVFYATLDEYACSVLVNIQLLRLVHHSKLRIIVLVSDGVSHEYHTKFKSLDAEVVVEKPLALHPESVEYYRDCLLKLAAYRMHEMELSAPVQRVLVLDSDQLILKNLDHLFDLPSADVYAPRAYWIEKEDKKPFLSSTLMLIQPNPELWKQIQDTVATLPAHQYDMDIVNSLFGDQALLLPDSYVVLNSHWEDHKVPLWFTPENGEPAGNVTEGDTSRPASNEELNALYDQSHVIHFTAVGKPWSMDLWTVNELKPGAHPVLLIQWEEWRVRANLLCAKGLVDTV